MADVLTVPAEDSPLHRRKPLAAILEPRTVAVIGASRKDGTVGNTILRNIFRSGFTGAVYPVNPNAAHASGVQAYAHVGDIPEHIDLAVICVPASAVEDVARECAAAGVGGLVVISAGFAEAGDEGAARQRELVSIARDAGMRLVGPNCLGVVNTHPGISLAATFAPVRPPVGSVGLLSQSGAVAIGIIEECRKHGLGLSSYVSVGNKADVSGNDLLEYWAGDPRTKVIQLYLESFGNPRRFSQLARSISRSKPIVAVKSGRTAVGGRAASSHSAALVTDDLNVNALFKQAGVIRVDTVRQMFDVTRLLVEQDLPKGRRIAIIGNSGGPAVMAADVCTAHGLDVPELSGETQAALRATLRPGSSVTNPVDMTAAATAAQYEHALQTVLDDPGVDAVLVIFTPLPPDRSLVVASAISGAAMHSGKPVITNFIAADDEVEALLGSRHIVNYETPEDAVFSLGKAVELSEWRRTSRTPSVALADADVDVMRGVVDAALIREPNGGWLDMADAARLLRAAGISVVDSQLARNVDEAITCAETFDGPVVMKTASRQLLHKTEVGGVKLDLRTEVDVRTAFVEMQSSLGEEFGDVIVQPMLQPGVELIAGAVQDPSFGPVVLFGLGGVNTEILGDRAACLAPLTLEEASKLVQSIKAAPLLFGHRGAPPVDVAALEDLVCRIGMLVHAFPEIVELDCNPVIATPAGATVVDIKIRVAPV